MHLSASFLPPDLSFAPTPSPFLLRLLYFLSLYPSKILVMALQYTYLLEVLSAISFLVVFASFSQLFQGSFLKFSVWFAIFNT